MLINCLWTNYPECHSCAKALFNVGHLYMEIEERKELRLQANTSGLRKYFEVLVLWKYFPVLVLWKLRFRSTFKYATSDFIGIPIPRALPRLACGSPFQKRLELEMPVKSSVLYLNYNVEYYRILQITSAGSRSLL